MTVEDVLRQTGISDDDIKKIDQKLIQGFGTVLNQASQAQTAAEAANTEAKEVERRYHHMYETEIVPALNNWGSEKATLEAQVEFYRKQNEGARTAGFVPKDAPGYQPANGDQARGSDGRYVAGGNPIPGSPGIAINDIMKGISNSQWAMQEYQRLYGAPMPEDYDFYSTLENATKNRMDFREYVARQYKFDEKRKELTERKQKEHDEAIRKETRQAVDKEWAEKTGSNPNVRTASDSRYASVRKAVSSGKAKDPLMMGADQRRQQTREMIRSDIADRESGGNA